MRIPKTYVPRDEREDKKPMPQTSTAWQNGQPYMTLVDETGDLLAFFVGQEGYCRDVEPLLLEAGYATDWAVWDEHGEFVRLKEED